MKLRAALIATTALLALPGAANAVVIGSVDAGNCYPFMCNDSGSANGQSFYYQQIYDGALFGGAVSFDTVTFFVEGSGAGTVLNGQYDISFSVTTDPVGSVYPIGNTSNTASFYNGDLGGVYNYSMPVTGAAYTYNPSNGNLLMTITVVNQDNVPNGSGNTYFYADYTGIQTSRAVDAVSGIFWGGGGLVTELNTTPAAVPEPASWALMIGGFGLIGTALRRRKVLVA